MKVSRPAVLTTVFLVVGILFLDNPKYVSAQQAKTGGVRFRWAFGAIQGQNHGENLIAITQDTVLKTGDQFKMVIEPQTRCYIYLLYRSSQDEIYMLFPYDIQLFTTDYEIDRKYYIPQGSLWFELDENIGIETFYLLAAGQRLRELETLYGRYSSTIVGTTSQQDTAKRLLAEIKRLKRKHTKLTAVAERPARIGGRVRGTHETKQATLPDVADIAVEISATDFYGRTFTIDHQ